ncbi:hypothetical protein BC937DRAFT_87578 [Endogone sp. FLAS-F59071]|nr:hypothetical protein BC937DRAFT_87578 [Endogone sp. FLAS-F59071]|eukprot:RUS19377.1 hypothetical protein BC937DRAFT_87578 [Endogone sp. FLAS-F59071]
MLVKYLSPFAYHFRLVRPPVYYLRTTLATRPSSFLCDRCAFYSDIPTSKSKDPLVTKDPPKSEANGAPKSEAKDGPKPESKDGYKSEAKDSPKSEAKDDHRSEVKYGPKPESKDGYKSEAKDSPKSEAKDDHRSESKDGHKSESKDAPKSDSGGPRVKTDERFGAGMGKDPSGEPKKERKSRLKCHRARVLPKIEGQPDYPPGYHRPKYGTGKTTALIQAADRIGKGIVYIQGSEELSHFSEAFANALEWKYEDVKVKLGPRDKLYRAMVAFRHSAAIYKAKYNKHAVLILDDISKLARKHPEVIGMLQDIAKDVADKEEFAFVFVTSEGTVPRLMSSNSSISRASPPLLIDDFTEDEALKYLQSILFLKGEKEQKEEEKERNDMAKQLYQLFGGRIKLLQTYGLMINKGISFEGEERLYSTE